MAVQVDQRCARNARQILGNNLRRNIGNAPRYYRGDVWFRVAGMRGVAVAAMLRPVRCLIVDDSPGFLAVAGRLLRGQGIIVAGVASTSAEALRRAEELRPDLALVDIDLGGESGLELVGRLPVPSILISTHDEQDYRELIAASPALGFLPKTALSARAIHALYDNSTTGPRET